MATTFTHGLNVCKVNRSNIPTSKKDSIILSEILGQETMACFP